MATLLAGQLRTAANAPHIWWGVSVEDRAYGVPRIHHLRHAPAAIRFLSIEPLLEDLGDWDLSAIDWVIVGGESGPGARPMEKVWVERIQRACIAAHTRFFFKQWGGVQKGKHGRILNGRTYDDMPSASAADFPSRPERIAFARAMDPATHHWPATPLN